MSFEWQTEEDYNWEEAPVSPQPPRRERRRWPWLVLATFLLVGTAVFLLYRQISQRVEAATGNIESDVVASYAVLQQAAQNKDENLFNSLLSGRDELWAGAQRENLRNDTLFDRQAFGLTWQPVLAETAVISQTFSPELTSVELTTLQNYSLNIGNGFTQTVPLMRVDVYRLGEDRWLYAPPEREFWGVRQRLEGQLISVRYPARDEAMVHRLSADLEARLVQVCSTPGFTCPEDAEVRLSFSAEPDSLTHFTFLDALIEDQASGDSVWAGGATVVLPTPTLVGLPQDETGYQALLRGYESYLLTVALNDLIGWECCEHLPFYQATVERQLYELGVGAWPLAGTAVSLSEDVYLLDVAADWNSPPSETNTEFGASLMPYFAIDFLVDTFGLSPAQIGQSLAANPDSQFNEWLAEITGNEFVYEALLNQTFQQYLSRRFGVAQVVPQPGYDMLLLCKSASDSQTALYQYDFGSGDPDLLQVLGRVDPFMTSLPDGSGVALAVEGGNGPPETYLLRQGKRIDVNWNNVAGITENPPLAIPTTTDPNGRYLLWTVAPTYSTGSYYALTDLETCQPGGSCEATPIGGYPNWSPDGQKLITLTTVNPWWHDGLDNGLMLLRDVLTANASNSPGFGASVFWLDDARFGYLNRYQNGVEQLVLTDVDLAPPTTLLTNGSLQGYLSPDERPDSLSLKMAQPLPENPDVLAVVAAGNFNLVDEVSPGYLFWYDRVADSVRMQVDLPNWQNSELEGYRFSPDGRYLLFTYTTPEETAVNLFLVDATEQQPRFLGYTVLGTTSLPHHFYASWTPDGEWLAMPELGTIRLWHNGLDEHILNFDGLNCTNAAWINTIES
ncbi:MAG: PD40 domain-containing protein [Ardenticatenaceae bacterium]|nr:PD40 domain-containing protein [Ardenticatenaceae bacterium]